jgi:hypothetical protein
MSEDPLRVLDEAVEIARRSGHVCTGWTLQSDDDGAAAWLYVEAGDEQLCLFERVDIHDTVYGAALACREAAEDLGVAARVRGEA